MIDAEVRAPCTCEFSKTGPVMNLLLSLDRLKTNEIISTQELIADMLGVRREGVADAALKLQRAGLIR